MELTSTEQALYKEERLILSDSRPGAAEKEPPHVLWQG
jgi:hypothetical protein